MRKFSQSIAFAQLILGIMFIPHAFAQASTSSSPKVTVESLLKEGYGLVGTLLTKMGPTLFLQKQESLYFCVVEETPTSPELKTAYCKIVR